MTSPPIALVDLDGTLADYDGAMTKALLAMRSPHEPELAWGRDHEEPWMEARRRAIATCPGFWSGLAPLEMGFEVYRELLRLEYKVCIVSKGPSSKPRAWEEKRAWCTAHVPEAKVSIVEDKSLSYGRVLVDDWPDYALPWLAVRPRGLVVMPAQPWNVGLVHPRIFRYTGAEKEELTRLLVRARDRGLGESFSVADALGRAA